MWEPYRTRPLIENHATRHESARRLQEQEPGRLQRPMARAIARARTGAFEPPFGARSRSAAADPDPASPSTRGERAGTPPRASRIRRIPRHAVALRPFRPGTALR